MRTKYKVFIAGDLCLGLTLIRRLKSEFMNDINADPKRIVNGYERWLYRSTSICDNDKKHLRLCIYEGYSLDSYNKIKKDEVTITNRAYNPISNYEYDNYGWYKLNLEKFQEAKTYFVDHKEEIVARYRKDLPQYFEAYEHLKDNNDKYYPLETYLSYVISPPRLEYESYPESDI